MLITHYFYEEFMTQTIEQKTKMLIEEAIQRSRFVPTSRLLAIQLNLPHEAVRAVLRRRKPSAPILRAPTSAQRVALVALRNLTIKNGCPPALRSIATVLGRSLTATHSAIAALIRKRLVSRTEEGELVITPIGLECLRRRGRTSHA